MARSEDGKRMTDYKEIIDRMPDYVHLDKIGNGEETIATLPQKAIECLSLAATIDRLKQLQRQRVFCIVQQSRANSSIGSYIVGLMGYRPDLPEAERKKLFKDASVFRKKVEAGDGQASLDNHFYDAVPIILAAAHGRSAFDDLRKQAEKEMVKLAKSLPVYPWAESIRGLGDKALAIIIAETGDLSLYANPAKVWKRLGLAVIAGERQRKKTNAEEALAHGYNPRRRAEMYASVGEPLFKHQSMVSGLYRQRYDARRAHTATTHSDWTKAHSHNDALRVMTKWLVKDLWRAWRAARSSVAPSFIMPPAISLEEGGNS